MLAPRWRGRRRPSSPRRAELRSVNGAMASDAEWDAFVVSHPDGHHEQSSRHGANRVTHGYQCDRVVVRDGGRIVAGAQVVAQRSPAGTHAVVLRGPLALGND